MTNLYTTDLYIMEREITYSQLHLLQEVFEQQVKEQNIVFYDEEQEELCFDDFIEQYVQGDDNPQIRIDR